MLCWSVISILFASDYVIFYKRKIDWVWLLLLLLFLFPFLCFWNWRRGFEVGGTFVKVMRPFMYTLSFASCWYVLFLVQIMTASIKQNGTMFPYGKIHNHYLSRALENLVRKKAIKNQSNWSVTNTPPKGPQACIII